MPTLTPKQQEIRDRERQILDVARTILIERGYLGLTMELIAEAMGCSKGTIYQHFTCKEDISAALVKETACKRTELFEKASTFRGRTRERMTAIGIAADIFVRLYPQHFQTETLVAYSSIREKVGPRIIESLRDQEFRCMVIAAGIVRDGIAQGDLELPEDVSPEQLTFGMWTMSIGSYLILTSGAPIDRVGIERPLDALMRNYQAMLDGYRWAPLTEAWNYEETVRRILQEVFAEEDKEVSLLPDPGW